MSSPSAPNALIEVSVLGANSLLGQHLLKSLVECPNFRLRSLHDRVALTGVEKLSESPDWQVDPAVARALDAIGVLPPDAPAVAPLLLSFHPDVGAETIEAAHLARGTTVLSHCEYARSAAPMVVPGVQDAPTKRTSFLSTPNCTTAICAPVLKALQTRHGIEHVTITAMQAISGTDLPGMPAYAIHDRVQGHLDGEAKALARELALLFNDGFGIDTFAARVPVWRGHTLTMSLRLQDKATAGTARQTLSTARGVTLAGPERPGRDYLDSAAPAATVTAIQDGDGTVQMVLTGDNLGAATVGLMLEAARQLA